MVFGQRDRDIIFVAHSLGGMKFNCWRCSAFLAVLVRATSLKCTSVGIIVKEVGLNSDGFLGSRPTRAMK